MFHLTSKTIPQLLYDLFLFIGILASLPVIKTGNGNIIGFAIVVFLFPFVSNDKKINKIAFSIIHSLLAWLSWTTIIAGYFTNFLYTHFIKEEHSFWDIFAYLIPFCLAIMTIVWDLKYRQHKKWYELAYLFCITATILIMSNYS